MIIQIVSVIKFLQGLNLEKGEKVAVISESRVEWVIADFACMFCKLISIPIYTSLSTPQIEYILQNSNSKVCIVSNALLLEKILKIKKNFQELKEIIVFQEVNPDKYKNEHVRNFSEIVKNMDNTSIEDKISFLKELDNDIDPEDLFTVIYTSGTSGTPKGVMLTHENIYTNVTSCQRFLPINEDDIFLSYLPYSHVYERTAGYYLPFFCGSKIYYAQNIDTIAGQLTEVRPTFVITVPRLLDKIYNKLMKSGNDMKDGIKKKLFIWAIDLAHSENASEKGIKWKIADKLVYKKIRDKTGGRIRYFVSGGGALNKSIGKFFDNIGVVVLEGYGLTETSPVISVNPPEKNKYGTVGKLLDWVEIKFSHENEILIKGDSVMKGYYNDDKITEEAINDNWLHTGDIGEMDSERYLKITDRKKALIKSSGGKYIAPAQIEEMISSLNYIEHAVIIGNERMYITALIVPDKSEIASFAKANNINFESESDLYSNSLLYKLIQKDIDNLQRNLSGYEKVKRFSLIDGQFSIEGGELTPTMKVKRRVVEEKYKDIVEKMYLKI